MFETTDGNPIEPGFFVALVEDKVRIANSTDRYVIGITSAKPAFLSNSGEMRCEWVDVGMLGKLLVRDDGSCQAGGLCEITEIGVATASDQGFYVLKESVLIRFWY